MFSVRPDAEWKRYGEMDPYFGVLSQQQYHGSHLNSPARAAFFRSGEEYIDFVLSTIRSRLVADFRPSRALDFGCGVGRLTIPLARVCSDVVGVDVSAAMLREAQRNCDEAGRGGVEFVCSNDQLSRVSGRFDFIHSFIVFQHIPPSRGLRLVRALLGRLTPGGVGALHFTYHRRAPLARRVSCWLRAHVPLLHPLVNVLRGLTARYPLMRMYKYDLNKICFMLQQESCERCHTVFTDHGGHLGAVLFFQKRR
jgi:SAM-dependent methyltransferase